MSGRKREEIARSLRGMCICNTAGILKLDLISSENYCITKTSFLLLEYL